MITCTSPGCLKEAVRIRPGTEPTETDEGQEMVAWCGLHDTLDYERKDQNLARKKHADASPPGSDDEEAAAQEAARLDDAVEVAATTLTGDLRDFVLDRLKHEQSKRPWHERSESDQRQVVAEVEHAVRTVIEQAVSIIAGHGRRTVRATLTSISVKDGMSCTLAMSKHDANRHLLIDTQGAGVLIVLADPDEYTGERSPVAVRPDQAELLGDKAMAVHSEGETPFH